MEARWWFQPLLKHMSQNGSFPQVGVKIKESLKPIYLGSLDPIPPHLDWASQTATACLMSSGVEASAKKALRDSAWRIWFFFWKELSWKKGASFGVQELQATSPLDASEGCDGENGRMVQSFMTKSQQKRLQDSEGVLISRLKVLIYTLKGRNFATIDVHRISGRSSQDNMHHQQRLFRLQIILMMHHQIILWYVFQLLTPCHCFMLISSVFC